jgi:LCP family protein required for cell wall assembly
VLALGLVFSIVVVSIVGTNLVVEAKLGSVERVDLQLAPTPSGGGGNFLLVGSDTRSFVSSEHDQQQFGDSGDADGQRSDTIMVLHVDPDSERSLLVSFPRDLWVNIPGRGNSKINAAFNDGPQAVIDTLQSQFDVPIQHYVEVNFDSFREIVDAIGSVPVYFPAAARDALSLLDIPVPGCNQLDGPAALSFVRSRHLQLLNPATGRWEDADPIPDIGRIGRQQAFLRELGREAMNAAVSNPIKGNDIVDRALGKLKLDQDFGRTDVFALIDAFASDKDSSGPESLTVPNTPATEGGQSVLKVTQPEADAMFTRLRDFETVVPDAPPDASSASPGDTKVKVLNASGAEGAAAKALSSLTGAGFHDGGSGNADGTLQTTEVRYPSGNDAQAALVASYVSGPVKLVEDSSVSGSDVTLVLGKSFGGITTPAAPAPTPSGGTGTPTLVDPGSLAPVPGEC